jgi:uronate dehydrogenase
VSKNKRSWYDNSNAYRLGYQPEDDSEQWAAEILAREKPGGDRIAELHQGGVFCVAEDIPNPAPLPIKKKKRK